MVSEQQSSDQCLSRKMDVELRTLSVSVSNLRYPITVDIMDQIFAPYGLIENIEDHSTHEECKFNIQYSSDMSASLAKVNLQERNIYDNCCQLYIQSCVQPVTIVGIIKDFQKKIDVMFEKCLNSMQSKSDKVAQQVEKPVQCFEAPKDIVSVESNRVEQSKHNLQLGATNSTVVDTIYFGRESLVKYSKSFDSDYGFSKDNKKVNCSTISFDISRDQIFSIQDSSPNFRSLTIQDYNSSLWRTVQIPEAQRPDWKPPWINLNFEAQTWGQVCFEGVGIVRISILDKIRDIILKIS